MSRAQAWYDERKRELAAMSRSNAYGTGSSNPMFGNSAGWLGGAGQTTGGGMGNGVTAINIPQGRAPTDADVQKYIMSLGGNPYSGRSKHQRGLAPSRGGSSRAAQVERAANAKSKKDAQSDLEKFFEEAQGKIDEANEANESRYQDILGRLTDRYDRAMGQVSKFGGAARADLEERAREGLGAIQANLSARGLGNSTIMSAFQQRSDRDLAREQQRISETVAQREMEWDSKLSGDTAAFMERKTENAPDYMGLMALANKYGVAGAGRGQQSGGTTGSLVDQAMALAQQVQGQQQQQMPYNPSAYAGVNTQGLSRPQWGGMANPYAGIGIQQPFSWGRVGSNWQSDPKAKVTEAAARKPAMAQDQDPFDAAKWAALDSQGGGAAQASPIAPETYGSDLPLRTPGMPSSLPPQQGNVPTATGYETPDIVSWQGRHAQDAAAAEEAYRNLPMHNQPVRQPDPSLMPPAQQSQQPLQQQTGRDYQGREYPSVGAAVNATSGRANPTGWGAPPSYGEPYTGQEIGNSIKKFFGSIIGGIPGVAPYEDGYDMNWFDKYSDKYQEYTKKAGPAVLGGLEYVDAQINGPRTDQWPPRYVTGPGGMAKPRGNPNVRQGEEQWSDVWTGNGYADGWMGTEALSGQRAQLAELMARGGSDPMGTIFGPVADSVTGLGRGVYNYATQPTQQMTQYNQGIHGTPNTQDYGGAYDSYNQMLQDYTAPHSLQSLRPQKFYSGGAY